MDLHCVLGADSHSDGKKSEGLPLVTTTGRSKTNNQYSCTLSMELISERGSTWKLHSETQINHYSRNKHSDIWHGSVTVWLCLVFHFLNHLYHRTKYLNLSKLEVFTDDSSNVAQVMEFPFNNWVAHIEGKGENARNIPCFKTCNYQGLLQLGIPWWRVNPLPDDKI